MKIVHVRGNKKRLLATSDEEAQSMVKFCERGGTVTWRLHQDTGKADQPGLGVYFESTKDVPKCGDVIDELETQVKVLQFELDTRKVLPRRCIDCPRLAEEAAHGLL